MVVVKITVGMVQLKQFRIEQPTHILNTRTRSQIVKIDVHVLYVCRHFLYIILQIQKKNKKNCRLFFIFVFQLIPHPMNHQVYLHNTQMVKGDQNRIILFQ